MERDHPETTSRSEHPECRRQRRLERAELAVHGDRQGLEDALRRVPVPEASRRRYRSANRLDEIGGSLEPFRPPPSDDRARNLARVPLLSVAPEDRREVALVRFVDDSGG